MSESKTDVTRARVSLLNNIRTVIKQGKLLKQGITTGTLQQRGRTLTFTIDEESLTRDKDTLKEQLKQYSNSLTTDLKKQKSTADIAFDKDFYTVAQVIDLIMQYIDDTINSRETELLIKQQLHPSKGDVFKESDLIMLLTKASVNDYIGSLVPMLQISLPSVTLEIPPLS